MHRLMLQRALRLGATRTKPSLIHRCVRQTPFPLARAASHVSLNHTRNVSSNSSADATIDDIAELYATAQDEFEIAMEETEKATVYAEEDRKAAREELGKVQEAYRKVVEGPDAQLAEEVRKRIGQRIRELEQGVAAMDKLAMDQE